MESAGAARETAGMAVDEEQPRLKRSRTRSRDRSQSRSSHQGSKQSRRREASARQSDRLARKRGKTSTAAARQSVGHEESSSSRLQLDSAANAVDGELEASQFFHHVPHLRPALIGWKLRTRALNRERKLQASSIAIPLANATPPRASSWRDLDGPEGARHEAKIGSRTSTSVSRRSKSARVDPPMGLRLNQPSERSLQVQKLHDLVHLMIAKRDPLRAARALRILMRCHEWRPIELYRMGLEIAGMGCVDKASDRRSVSDLSQPSLHATRAKLNYIRALSSKRAFHRANLLVELVPNLIAMGQGREALEEISIVITSWPFRSEPMLHLYAGLLILQLGALELPTEDVPKDESSNMRAPEVHIPPFDPERDADLLRVASHHFEGCINAGATQSTLINMERQRLQTSQKLKTKKAKRRMRSGLKKRKRGIAETDDSGEEEEEEEEEQGEGGEGNVEDAIDINTNAARDQWAVEMARAYLDLIRTWLPRRSRSASAAESQRRLKRELIEEDLEYRERRETSSNSSSSSSSSSSRTNVSAPSQASSSSSGSASDASRASSDSDSSASDSDSR